MNPVPWTLVTAYLRDGSRWHGHPLADEIVRRVCELKVGARAAVYRATEGCFESGEIASSRILVLSADLPVKVEILVPETDSAGILTLLEEMVDDGIVGATSINVAFDRTSP